MRFNKYIWHLYKNSSGGEKALKKWMPSEVFPDEQYALEVKKPSTIENLLASNLGKYVNGSTVNFRQLRFDYFKSRYDFSKVNIRDLYAT